MEEMKTKNQELKRSQPYILKIKPGTYFVMIEDCAITIQPSSMAMALDTLFKSFYVFNMELTRSLSVMFGFLGSFAYKIKGLINPRNFGLTFAMLSCETLMFVKYLWYVHMTKKTGTISLLYCI